MAFYSNYRIRRLGLDGVLDYVFCPRDHVLPGKLRQEDLRKYPAQHYKLRYTIQEFTPAGSKKPDPVVLQSIVEKLRLDATTSVYLGDSLMKDVPMAQDCGVEDVWAKYGEAHKRPEYKLLQDVTHWSAEDVAREQKIKERRDILPAHTLDKSFAQILDLFDLADFHG
jgi:FMN phosphatase YigB (HAD superfamily)